MVVGLVELTVVEPISKVVLDVEEKRHVATPLTFTGQWANLARLGGSVPLWAETGLAITRSDTPASAMDATSATPRRTHRGNGPAAEGFVMSTITPVRERPERPSRIHRARMAFDADV